MRVLFEPTRNSVRLIQSRQRDVPMSCEVNGGASAYGGQALKIQSRFYLRIIDAEWRTHNVAPNGPNERNPSCEHCS